ncbi:inositol phosphorylceramide synthase [Chryseolinea sp. Jin1]|uniref:Inositol phosphorylceramide synthase n=2 Tax=Chryseolinea lacunae TaxID=2801331 RepID=A0ABS1KJJ3_9BACT|nr:inositol phosphorylceramide synthase [Chryseolinea lacunae]
MTAGIISATYLLTSFLLLGFKADQLVLVLVFSALYIASVPTRKFILGFSVFIVFWIIFDYMKAFPNYRFNDVHIEGLYHAEAKLFGIKEGNTVLTPNEYWDKHSFAAGDVVSGLFYLCWIPVPLAFGTYLFFTDKAQFLKFALTFLLTNLLGFVVYYSYPAAPPWYVKEHGFEFLSGTRGNTAGLVRFDHFFNITIFQSLYTKGSNVFAAMPSLHSAYPLVVFYYAWKSRMGYMTFVFGIITVGIWLAAVYSGHHYILDVFAGIAIAALGIAVFSVLYAKNKTFSGFVDRYRALIS